MKTQISENGKKLCRCGEDDHYTTPDDIIEIGANAFLMESVDGFQCRSLKKLTLSAEVRKIGACSVRVPLEEYQVAANNPQFSVIDGVLFSAENRYLVAFPLGKKIDCYTVPASVVVIDEYAFENSSLQEITLSPNIKVIGKSSFKNCKMLKKITLFKGVKVIKDQAFEDCRSMETIELPDTLVAICFSTFADCTALTSIVIPDGVDKIGLFAFQNCSSLKSVALGSGVKSIGDYAFENCISMTSVVTSPILINIGAGAFRECSCLKEIVLPKTVRTIGEFAFKNCKSLTKLAAHEGIKEIADNAFDGCDLLTIYAPNGSCVEGYAKKHHIDFKPLK